MEDTRSRWARAFVEALDHDTWGQVSAEGAGLQLRGLPPEFISHLALPLPYCGVQKRPAK